MQITARLVILVLAIVCLALATADVKARINLFALGVLLYVLAVTVTS